MKGKKCLVLMSSGKKLEGEILFDKSEYTGYTVMVNYSVHYNVAEEFVEIIKEEEKK